MFKARFDLFERRTKTKTISNKETYKVSFAVPRGHNTERPFIDKNGKIPEKNSLLRYKNTKETILNHKGTRMVKNGEA